jgi:hypothetical protein
MATDAQIEANRLNARKSTGSKTGERKAMVAQNALKRGLFAHQNVINCEKVEDCYEFHTELLAGLARIGGIETMMFERIESSLYKARNELGKIRRVRKEEEDDGAGPGIPSLRDEAGTPSARKGAHVQNKANWDEVVASHGQDALATEALRRSVGEGAECAKRSQSWETTEDSWSGGCEKGPVPSESAQAL